MLAQDPNATGKYCAPFCNASLKRWNSTHPNSDNKPIDTSGTGIILFTYIYVNHRKPKGPPSITWARLPLFTDMCKFEMACLFEYVSWLDEHLKNAWQVTKKIWEKHPRSHGISVKSTRFWCNYSSLGSTDVKTDVRVFLGMKQQCQLYWCEMMWKEQGSVISLVLTDTHAVKGSSGRYRIMYHRSCPIKPAYSAGNFSMFEPLKAPKNQLWGIGTHGSIQQQHLAVLFHWVKS